MQIFSDHHIKKQVWKREAVNIGKGIETDKPVTNHGIFEQIQKYLINNEELFFIF
jgi:hypothetical protein